MNERQDPNRLAGRVGARQKLVAQRGHPVAQLRDVVSGHPDTEAQRGDGGIVAAVEDTFAQTERSLEIVGSSAALIARSSQRHSAAGPGRGRGELPESAL